MEKNVNELKIMLLQGIIACNELDKLSLIQKILDKEQTVQEESAIYSIEKSALTDKQWKEIEAREEAFNKGKLETHSWKK